MTISAISQGPAYADPLSRSDDQTNAARFKTAVTDAGASSGHRVPDQTGEPFNPGSAGSNVHVTTKPGVTIPAPVIPGVAPPKSGTIVVTNSAGVIRNINLNGETGIATITDAQGKVLDTVKLNPNTEAAVLTRGNLHLTKAKDGTYTLAFGSKSSDGSVSFAPNLGSNPLSGQFLVTGNDGNGQRGTVGLTIAGTYPGDAIGPDVLPAAIDSGAPTDIHTQVKTVSSSGTTLIRTTGSDGYQENVTANSQTGLLTITGASGHALDTLQLNASGTVTQVQGNDSLSVENGLYMLSIGGAGAFVQIQRETGSPSSSTFLVSSNNGLGNGDNVQTTIHVNVAENNYAGRKVRPSVGGLPELK